MTEAVPVGPCPGGWFAAGAGGCATTAGVPDAGVTGGDVPAVEVVGDTGRETVAEGVDGTLSVTLAMPPWADISPPLSPSVSSAAVLSRSASSGVTGGVSASLVSCCGGCAVEPASCPFLSGPRSRTYAKMANRTRPSRAMPIRAAPLPAVSVVGLAAGGWVPPAVVWGIVLLRDRGVAGLVGIVDSGGGCCAASGLAWAGRCACVGDERGGAAALRRAAVLAVCIPLLTAPAPVPAPLLVRERGAVPPARPGRGAGAVLGPGLRPVLRLARLPSAALLAGVAVRRAPAGLADRLAPRLAARLADGVVAWGGGPVRRSPGAVRELRVARATCALTGRPAVLTAGPVLAGSTFGAGSRRATTGGGEAELLPALAAVPGLAGGGVCFAAGAIWLAV